MILPDGLTQEDVRAELQEKIDEYRADDVRSLQILGAAMVREYERVMRLEGQLARSQDDLHVIAEVQQLLTDVRHEMARAKAHIFNRATLIERYERHLRRLEAQA